MRLVGSHKRNEATEIVDVLFFGRLTVQYLVPCMETYGVHVLFRSLGTTQVFETFGGDKHCGGSQHDDPETHKIRDLLNKSRASCV